jgi:hypothetical protein
MRGRKACDLETPDVDKLASKAGLKNWQAVLGNSWISDKHLGIMSFGIKVIESKFGNIRTVLIVSCAFY